MNELETKKVIKIISNPQKVWSRKEVLSKPNPVPLENGIYAWFFKSLQLQVPIKNCLSFDDKVLLYAGISPKNDKSTQNLRKRIATHFRGNAEGSTLRLTLGSLLSKKSGYELRRVGSGKRKTFTHLGEQWLDEWMNDNAFVFWVEHKKPWLIEKELLRHFSLPLNIQDNDHHPFSKNLSNIRTKAKRMADQLPIANEGNQQRTMPK